MKKIFRIIVLALFVITHQIGNADAMPKGYQLYEFNSGIKVDSLFVFESDSEESLEKLDINTNMRPWVTICEDNSCRAKASKYLKYQRILVYVKGQPIESNIYEPKGTNPTFKAEIIDGVVVVEETTSFIFKGIIGEILRALFLTLILEFIIGLFFFGFKDKKALKVILLINCITLPIAWFIFPYINKIEGFSVVFSILVLEVLILFAEYFGYTKILKKHSKRRLFFFALVANMVSFFIGGLLYVVSLFI